MFTVRSITDRNRNQLQTFFETISNTESFITKGIEHHLSALEGFIAYLENEIVGFLTYDIKDCALEVVAIDGLDENSAIDSSLLDLTIQRAKSLHLDKVWSVTTNDNIPVMQFFEKKDFRKKQVYYNSIKKARSKFPQIPEKGYQNIPILHEIEFEYLLQP